MSTFTPPDYNSDQFNSGLFEIGNQFLTLTDCDKRYLKLGGGVVNGLTTFSSGLNSTIISATTRLETANTSATVLTSSSTCDQYGLHLHSILASSNGVYSGSSIAFNNSSLDNTPLANIYLDKIGSGNGNLVFGARNGATCNEVMRITSAGVDITGTIKNNGTTLNLSYITGVTAGTATASKAMVLDGSTGISSMNYINFNSPSAQSIYITGNSIYEAFGINNGTSNFGIFNNGSAGYVRMTSNHPLYFGTNGSIRFQIAANGRLMNSASTPAYDIDFRGCMRSEGILASVSTATGAAPAGNIWSYNAGMAVGDRQFHFQFGRTTTDSDFAHYRIESVYSAAADKGNNHMVIRQISANGGFSMNGWGDVRITGRNGGAAQQTTIAACEVVGYENATVPSGYGYFKTGQSSIPGGTVPISLQCSNDFWCSGTIYVTSDKRLKTDIRYLEDNECLQLLQLKPCDFYWKKDKTKDYKCHGLIAQEVLEVLPELVGIVPNNELDDGLQLVLSMEKFIPYLIGLAKVQEQRIKKLEDALADLLKRV